MEAALVVCTVDHGIRASAEGAGDAAFVAALCARLGLPHFVVRVPPGLLAEKARQERRSLEEVARERRRGLLQEAARQAGAGFIALGHTRDDLAETLLMRVFQGSDSAGLRGFGVKAGPFIRPLIHVGRSAIVAYLRSRGEAWREDSSNTDEHFLRNAIRHSLVPSLDRAIPGWRTGLLALSRKASLADDALRTQAEMLTWTPETGGFSIARQEFAEASPAVRARSLMLLYDRLPVSRPARRLPWRFLAPALDAVLPERLSLRGHGAALEIRAGRLFWLADLASPVKRGYFIVVFDAGTFAAGDSGMRVSFARSAGGEAGTSTGTAILEEKVRPPLILRSRRRGDELRLSKGAVSVKEMLDRWGVAEPERDRVPLVADRAGLLAILGAGLGFDTPVREGALDTGRGRQPRITITVERDSTGENEGGKSPSRGTAGRRAATGT
jgi:tRNA(Ile)-lysidine synthase